MGDDFFVLERNLKNYGKILVENVPARTTQLLQRVALHQNGRADVFYHCFAGVSTDWFVKFLEATTAGSADGGSASGGLTTLLELYFRAGRFDDAMRLLREARGDYDSNQIMILAKSHGCHEAVLFLYDRSGLVSARSASCTTFVLGVRVASRALILWCVPSPRVGRANCSLLYGDW